MKSCFNLALIIVFFSKLLSAEEIPLGGMPEIVAEQFIPFIKSPGIRGFLHERMKVDLENGGIKIFGSTVLAQTHKDIQPGDVDLIALSPRPRKSIIINSFQETNSDSEWELIKAKNRTFENIYGTYIGVIASFRNKTKGITIDVLFMEEEHFRENHDPVFVMSSKIFEYYEKSPSENFFKVAYLKEEDFGGKENIEYQIQNKIIQLPRYHGNDAAFFRMIYTMVKFRFMLANRMTLERALFCLFNSERKFENLKLLSDEKARQTEIPSHYYSLMISLVDYSLSNTLKRSKDFKKYYNNCFLSLNVENIKDLREYFFRPTEIQLHLVPQFLRDEVAYTLYFLKEHDAFFQTKYENPTHITLKEFFSESEHFKLQAFINLNKVVRLSPCHKNLFPNPGLVEVQDISIDSEGLVRVKLATKSGSLKLSLNTKKEQNEIKIIGTTYTIEKTSKLKLVVKSNEKEKKELTLAAIESFINPYEGLKHLNGSFSFILDEHASLVSYPQSLYNFLENYGTETFKSNALSDLEIISAQSLLNPDFCKTLSQKIDFWIEHFEIEKKKRLKKQKQKEKKKSKKAASKKPEDHEIPALDANSGGASAATSSSVYPYDECIKKWRKQMSSPPPQGTLAQQKKLLVQHDEFTMDLCSFLTSSTEFLNDATIARAAEDYYLTLHKHKLVRLSTRKSEPTENDLMIAEMHYKLSFFLILFHLQNHASHEQAFLNTCLIRTADYLACGEEPIGSVQAHPVLASLNQSFAEILEKKDASDPKTKTVYGFLFLRKIINSFAEHLKDCRKRNPYYENVYQNFIINSFLIYCEIFSQLDRKSIPIKNILGVNESIQSFTDSKLINIFDAFFYKETFDLYLTIYEKNQHLYNKITKKFGKKIKIPFPTVFNFMLSHLSKEEVFKSLLNLFCRKGTNPQEVENILVDLGNIISKTEENYNLFIGQFKKRNRKLAETLGTSLQKLMLDSSLKIETIP